MMRSASAFVCLCAITVASAQSTDSQAPLVLKNDPKLSGTVTLHVKDEPIDAVMKELAKQTKSMIEAAGSMSDLKLTIFVDKEPAGLLMDKIASVLGGAWIKDAGIDILTMTRSETSKRQKFIDQEDIELRASAESEAKKLADAAGSASNFKDFNDSYGKDEGLTPSDLVGPRRFIRGQHAGPQMLLASPAAYALGKLFSNWSSGDWDRFWGGDVAYTTVVPEGRPVQAEPQEGPPQPHETQKSIIFARYDAFGDHNLEFAQPPRGRYPHGIRDMGVQEMSPTLAGSDWGREIRAWPNLTGKEEDEALTQPLAPPPPATAASEDPGFVPPATRMADQLESLFQRSGLPIVADGFRTSQLDPIEGKDAVSWLASLKSQDRCDVRIEDGVVMVRHGHFWRLRLSEIPEDLIRPMAEKAKSLTVLDYANFVSTLTPAQIAPLVSFTPPVFGFPLDVIQNSVPALRFIGAVGSSLSAGTAVRYSQLNGSAQQAFTEALFKGLFMGGNWNGPGPGLDPSRCWALVKAADVTDNGRVVPGVSVVFGTSPTDSISYDIPIPPSAG